MSYHDDKLDEYIRKMKESDDYRTKLKYYKRARNRLDHLKSRYNEICEELTNMDVYHEYNDLDVETLSAKLDKLTRKINDSHDIYEMAEHYRRVIAIIFQINEITEEANNEINIVKTNDNNHIKIEKLDINKLL